MQEMFAKKGFSFIEVLSPCPTLYQRRNKMGDGLDTMKFYKQVSKVVTAAPTKDVGLTKSGEIVVGKFVDRERNDYGELMHDKLHRLTGRRVRGNGGMLMPVTEIRIAGFGGQGVILSAIVIGKAGCIYHNGYSTMTQNFGPEARGGACSAQVILSDEPVLYPYVTQPDILVVMSQEAYTLFSPQINPNGILVIEEDLVRIGELPAGVRVYSIPATRIAEELGKKMVLNIVMVGFFAAIARSSIPTRCVTPWRLLYRKLIVS